MEKLTKSILRQIISKASEIMDVNRDFLIELDREIGDSDLGLTMSKGFEAAKTEAQGNVDEDIGIFLKKVGFAISKAAPSTMGTLMATAFISGGKVVTGKTDLIAADIVSLFKAMADGVAQRGKAKCGEKTVLDVLYPAADTIAASTETDIGKLFGIAEQAAAEGLEKTKTMMSQHGKAAVFREKTIGRQDPGGTAVYLLIKAFSEIGAHY
jgi:dihydroxyacetone kinase-like protein